MENIFSNMSPLLIWFLIGLVLLVAEMIIPGFIIFFFGLGAWFVAAVLLFVDISLNFQLVVFLVTSLLMLFLLRKKFTSLFSGFIKEKQPDQLNVDDFIGGTAIVTDEILPGTNGRVDFRGSTWKAIADTEIAAGEEVDVVEVDNLTLIVKKK